YLVVGGMPAAVSKYIESNNLQAVLPGTYTTTISGQCSARGHCPPAARLRRQQCKKIPLVYFANTQEVRIYLSKKI
ncbi:hypothetical protein, partial [Phascolarctobacterium faecium]|uniref:hypothetical protein n=1 Tax=Phascolarctobacterium faecium TaxID=33025 RepID=UPI003AB87EB8